MAKRADVARPCLPPPSPPLQLGKYDAKGESAEAAKGMYEKGYTY